ncbi:MAG: AAA family ATPase [Polyangiaceae bacterium]|nr:AAA family ATPase [Polyangiaceae bacterium]
MITSVRLQKFRGFDDVTIPLTRVTMLTGANGIGKTSVLEGLYCMFSETRLDVAPLRRYDRTGGASEWVPIVPREHDRRGFDYEWFWDECLAFGEESCKVSVESDDGALRVWSCTRCAMSGLDDAARTAALRSNLADSNSQLAVFNWTLSEPGQDGERVGMSVSQVLGHVPGLRLVPNSTADMPSMCCYVDYASARVPPFDLPYRQNRKLLESVKLLDKRVTDVRLTRPRRGLSAILDDSQEVSLGALGTGTIGWAATHIALLEAVGAYERRFRGSGGAIPVFVLVDEIGDGLHHSVIDRTWAFLRSFVDEHPYIQFVVSTHSTDCVRAFCDAFDDNGECASVVTMYRTFDGEFVTIPLMQPQFEHIISGQWEVRG